MLKLICLSLFTIILFSCDNTTRNKELNSKNPPFVTAKKIPSKIDSLGTREKVEQFIKEKDTALKNFRLVRIQDFNRDNRFPIDSISKRTADSLGVDKSFYKADFDNNGYTDLLYIGEDHYCSKPMEEHCNFSCGVLMSFENDSIAIRRLTHLNWDSFVPFVNLEGEHSKLTQFVQGDYHWRERRRRSNDFSRQLVYKFDRFIEYNPKPKKYDIEEIYLSSSSCYGTCPVFKIKINQKKESFFRAKMYNFNKERNDFISLEDYEKIVDKEEGVYSVIIQKKDYQGIIDLLNYIDFPSLKNNYHVNWTDDQGVTLIVTYNNGKKKMINDYGMIGTCGLELLYKKIFDLRLNQNWKDITPKDDKSRNKFRDSIFQVEFEFIKNKQDSIDNVYRERRQKENTTFDEDVLAAEKAVEEIVKLIDTVN